LPTPPRIEQLFLRHTNYRFETDETNKKIDCCGLRRLKACKGLSFIVVSLFLSAAHHDFHFLRAHHDFLQFLLMDAFLYDVY
jgi:hypothetical protein